MKASHVVLATPLVTIIGLCLHTYHVCGHARASGGHPFSGTCGDNVTVASRTSVTGVVSGPSDAASSPVPSELWVLLELIVTVVERSVYGYVGEQRRVLWPYNLHSHVVGTQCGVVRCSVVWHVCLRDDVELCGVV